MDLWERIGLGVLGKMYLSSRVVESLKLRLKVARDEYLGAGGPEQWWYWGLGWDQGWRVYRLDEVYGTAV